MGTPSDSITNSLGEIEIASSESTSTILSSRLSRTRMNSWDRETVSVPSISDKFENTTNVTSHLQPNHQPDHLQNHQPPNARRKVAPVETSGHSVVAWMISARIISWSAKIVVEPAGTALVSCHQTKAKVAPTLTRRD